MNTRPNDYEFTQNNHLKWGVLTSGKAFTALGRCERAPATAFEEAILAARAVEATASSHGLEVVLCMSGGVDSEAMALAFKAAGVRFRVAIFKFARELNEFDISDARAFCVTEGVPYKEIELDVVDYFQNFKHMEYAIADGCRSPQIAAHCHFLERVEGFPVLAWNPTLPYVLNGRLSINLPGEPHLALPRFMKRIGKPGAPFFFLQTPMLAHAFLRTDASLRALRGERNPDMRRLYAERFQRPLGTSYEDLAYLVKVASYQDSGFKVSPKSNKATGFELVKAHFEKLWIQPELFQNVLQDGIFEYLFRRPLERALPGHAHRLKIFDPTYLGLNPEQLSAIR